MADGEPSDLSVADPVSTSSRVLGVLDLFTEAEPVWTTERMAERLAASRATIYRYLQALMASGFLSQLGGGAYALGPRIIELDRQMRVADPVLRVAPGVMAAQRDQVAGTQLLCRYYGLRVFSIFEERSDPRIRTSFDRGRPFSLFRSSASRIILANLPSKHLRRLFLQHAGDIAAAGLGTRWPEFRDLLKAVRKRGVAVASDIDTELIGIAAPIFAAPEIITGSLVLVRIRSEVTDRDTEFLSALALDSARQISARLEDAGL
ncbi:MAG: IclR family transcriptional regulator C-terminal domain-containing protein [Rhodopila sp.]|nr:IclR family transcriptional regulator C-terminal domain-containing protein [Rhodopila sp.]